MLRIYQGEFSYFTRPNSFYPKNITKGEPPNIKKRPNKQSAITDGTGSKEEDRRREAVMREFVRKRRTTGKRPLKNKGAYWHPSVRT